MPEGDLIEMGVQVEGAPETAMVDSGAMENFVSESAVDSHQWQCTDSLYPLRVTLADGSQRTITRQVYIHMTIPSEKHGYRLLAHVIPSPHPIILGQPWLRYANPQIDWQARTIGSIRQNLLPRSVNIPATANTTSATLSSVNNSSDPRLTYPDVFPDELPDGLPPKRPVDHVIRLKEGSVPPKSQIYGLSPRERQVLEDYVEKESAAGRIRPSNSPYGAPILFVPKKDDTLRLCVDYRGLNEITIKDEYPLPRIDEMLEQLKDARIFSKIDLKSGYNQIRVAPEDIPKTAFKCHKGLFEYTVLPFGLCNVPGTFQRMVNSIFGTAVNKFVVVYLDDILIFSRTRQEHEEHVKWVMDKLRENKLYGSAKKCEFYTESTEYLGHIVGHGMVKMDKGKVASIHDWPALGCKRDVQSFLGMANFYRRFIKSFSAIAAPLTALLKGEDAFSWEEAQQQAFGKLKQAFTELPVLRIYDPSAPIRVTTDASKDAIGGVLEQQFGTEWHPIAFESRKLIPAERNYPTHEQELLAIIHALKKWRQFLEGAPQFTVLTDHHALKYVKTQKNLSR